MIIKKEGLLNAVRNCCKATNKTGVNDSFKSIFISGNEKEVMLYAFSPEMSVKEAIDVPADSNFKLAIDATLLFNAVSKLTSEEVKMEVSTEGILLKAGRMKINIPAMAIPFIEPQSFNIVKEIEADLYEDLTEVVHALANASTDNKMRSVSIELSDEGYSVTALDGYRISRRTCNMGATTSSFVALGKSFLEACSIVSNKGKDTVKISIAEAKDVIILSNSTTEIAVKTLNGGYFNISNIISACGSEYLRVDKEIFMQAIDACSVFSDAVKMYFSNDNIVVKSFDGVGKTEVEVEIKESSVKETEVGANANYIKQALNSLSGEDLYMYISGSKHPFFMTDSDLSIVMEVIVPINIK